MRWRTGQALLLQENSFFVLYKDRKVRNDLRITQKVLSTLQELPSFFFVVEGLDLHEGILNFFIVPEDGACVVHILSYLNDVGILLHEPIGDLIAFELNGICLAYF